MRIAIRTTALFLALTLLFVAVGALVGYFVNELWLGILIMIIFAVIVNAYSFFFSKKTVLRRHKVRIVTEAEQPRLYRIVRETSQKAGLPMPQVGVMQNPSPNAFATGRGPKDAAVVATSGLLDLLNDDELAGVMAHELAHVKNRDVLIMSVAATVAGIISYIANYLLWIGLLSGGGRNNNNNGVMLAAAIIGYITLPLAAALIQLSISRGREFGADKTGAEFTGNPMALASALRRLETGIKATSIDSDKYHENPADAHLWIEAPAAKGKSKGMSLFSTHPSTDERIRRLEAQAGKMGVTQENNPFL